MFSVSPVCKQFLTIIACNLLVMSYGWSSGWSSINLKELNSETSAFAVKGLSEDETSFVISILYAGSFTGTCIVIPISQVIGIKRTIHLFGLPLIASSFFLLWAQNVYCLYASRFLCGMVSGALVVGIPTLVNDISSDNVRGALNSLYDLFSNSGTIISFFLGNYLTMLDQVKTQLIVPIIFLVVMSFLPESPEYWVRNRKEKRAIKSVKFYKGEIDKLECMGFTSNVPCVEAANETKGDSDDGELCVQDFLTAKAKKAICVAFVSLLLSFFSCATVTFNYVEDIFKRTGSTSSKEYSLLISIVQLVANLIFLNIVERFKRRTLYIWSSILTTVSYCLYGTYCLLLLHQPQYEFISVVCFVCITFISCMGMVPIPYILAVEIFPRKIRKISLTAAILMMWIVFFALDRVFPAFLGTFGLHYSFYILAAMSLSNAIFGIFYIPETKGKTHEEIMELLEQQAFKSH